MWDEHKRSRFQQLRQGEAEGSLTEAEQVELARLVQELEAAEAAYLNPATQRLRQERQALETQNPILEALTHRSEALAARLRDFLGQARAEQRAIE